MFNLKKKIGKKKPEFGPPSIFLPASFTRQICRWFIGAAKQKSFKIFSYDVELVDG